MEKLKSAVRPVIVLCLLGTIIAMWLRGMPVPQELRWSFVIVIIEYFGERAIKRIKEM